MCSDFDGFTGDVLPEWASSCPLMMSFELRRLFSGRYSREVRLAKDAIDGGMGRLRREGGTTPPASVLRTSGSRTFSLFGSARDDIGARRCARCDPAVVWRGGAMAFIAPNSLTDGRLKSAVLDVCAIVLDIAPPPKRFALLLVVKVCGYDGGGMLPLVTGEGTLGRLAIRGIFVGVEDGISRDGSDCLREEDDCGCRIWGEAIMGGRPGLLDRMPESLMVDSLRFDCTDDRLVSEPSTEVFGFSA